MFSGIIEQIGTIARCINIPSSNPSSSANHGVRATIHCQPQRWINVEGAPPLTLGESIAVDGVCLTVIEWLSDGFIVELSPETLQIAKPFLTDSSPVNLERALRYGQLVGGHLVSGHVDGVGEVVAIRRAQDFCEYVFRVPEKLAKAIVSKGCLAINGCSLTVNAISGDLCTMMMIPHTLAHTNIGNLKVGSPINLETDLMAKYLAKLYAPN